MVRNSFFSGKCYIFEGIAATLFSNGPTVTYVSWFLNRLLGSQGCTLSIVPELDMLNTGCLYFRLTVTSVSGFLNRWLVSQGYTLPIVPELDMLNESTLAAYIQSCESTRQTFSSISGPRFS
jgi:hypothetical protein